MEYVIRHWYEFAVFIASIAMLTLVLGSWNLLFTVLLLQFVFIQFHFFEEFGLPGGFIWVGYQVEPRPYTPDVSKWSLNQASCFWGNEWFALAVYLLPIFLPQLHWAILAAVIFGYVELLLHVVFDIGIRSWYNPGLFTAGCLALISTWHLMQIDVSQMFTWWDLIIAILWCAFNYWMAFESPVASKLTANHKYAFTSRDVLKAKRYLQKQPGAIAELKNFGTYEDE